MRRFAFVVFILITLLLFSCDVELLTGEENINDYIYPYLEFTPDASGSGYIATIVEGARLEEVYIPSRIEINGKVFFVTSFAGFKKAEDAVTLKTIKLESASISIASETFVSSENFVCIEVEKTSEVSTWGKLPKLEKQGYEFDGWYIKDTEIKVKEGDKLIFGFTTLVPRWKEHNLKYYKEVAKTCTHNGTKAHYKCESCQKIFTDDKALNEVTFESLVILASHTLTFIESKEATCTENGNSSYYVCSVCSQTFSDKDAKNYLSPEDTVITAKGHTGVLIEAKVATCTEAGNTAYYRCERCEHLFSDAGCTAEITAASTVTPALGHNWTYKYGEKIADGHWQECTRCHETKETTPHTFSEGIVTLEPTHDKAGTRTSTCSMCSAVKKEDIMPIGDHNWVEDKTVDATCEEQGYTLYKCTVSECKATYKGNYTNPAGHTLVHHDKVSATCTKAGVEAYYQCSTCDKYFLDAEGKNEIAAPGVIKATGHSWGGVYYQDDTKNVHYVKCTNAGCNERKESAHVYENITEGRTPVKSQTCTTGAEYRKSCVCGKESTETFIAGSGYGHKKVKHDAVASNCSVKGHKVYYTCSNECCKGKYYSDEALTTEVTYDSLLLDYASHVYTSGTFEKTADNHTYVCDACHQETKTENHTKTYEHDFYNHWWKCNICGYESSKASHTLIGEQGKRICKECGYCETESQREESGFEVHTIDREPHGTLTAVQSGTTWTFTLTSTNPDAVPATYTWHVDKEIVDAVTGNVLVLNAPEKRSYRIMCVFEANGRYSSESMTITGGE